MEAGKLKHVITINRYSIITDEYGATDRVLTSTKKVRAHITTASRKREVDDMVYYESSIIFYVRNQIDVMEGDIIQYNNKSYRITGIEEDYNDKVKKISIVQEL